VTGTKGKSTTATMLGLVLARKFNTFVGGNIGRPLLNDLPRIGKTDLVVLELSSFMLHHLRAMRWSPHVAVVTMLSADHLDWHGTREDYLRDKRGIVEFQRGDDFAVLCEDCALGREWAAATRGRVILYGLRDRKPLKLRAPGAHNQLNAQAALAAASLLDLTWDDAQEALADFRGLPHRLRLVCERDGVCYYDDSIATIPEAAVAALESFPSKKVIQIVGGSDKGLPFGAMCAQLTRRAKAVLCIGATGPLIASIMAQSEYPGAAAVYECGDLPTAMKLAGELAACGDVVLLSPGCASFGQFTNFEQRGEMFEALARDAQCGPDRAIS
jgi:UDP-N-acetylmuramoylalanine--D-glutamate ligase